MLRQLLVFAATLLFACQAEEIPTYPGITASLDKILVEHHKKKIANFVIKKLNTVKIPDIVIPVT